MLRVSLYFRLGLVIGLMLGLELALALRLGLVLGVNTVYVKGNRSFSSHKYFVQVLFAKTSLVTRLVETIIKSTNHLASN